MAIQGLDESRMAIACAAQRLQRRAWCWFRRAVTWADHPWGHGLVTSTGGIYAGSPVVAGSGLSVCLGFRTLLPAPPSCGQLGLFAGAHR